MQPTIRNGGFAKSFAAPEDVINGTLVNSNGRRYLNDKHVGNNNEREPFENNAVKDTSIFMTFQNSSENHLQRKTTMPVGIPENVKPSNNSVTGFLPDIYMSATANNGKASSAIKEISKKVVKKA